MASDRDELHAWVDGRLEGERLRRFERRLDADAALRAEAHQWRRHTEALRDLGRAMLDDAIPPRLLEAVSGSAAAGSPAPDGAAAARGAARPADPAAYGEARPAAAAARGARTWRTGGAQLWLAAAALAALSWSFGWVSHARFAPPAQRVAAAPPAFVRDALAAHVVYVPEVRHPVEVAAAQHEHLVQWLSKRLGAPLTVPSLEAAGWSLVGGRLLPGTEGARAQFMYQDAGGARLTLYVADAGPTAADTAFRFDREGGLSAFYWVDGRFGYALSAQTDRATLLALAEEVYRQLARTP